MFKTPMQHPLTIIHVQTPMQHPVTIIHVQNSYAASSYYEFYLKTRLSALTLTKALMTMKNVKDTKSKMNMSHLVRITMK